MAKGDGSIIRRGRDQYEVQISLGYDPVAKNYPKFSRIVHGSKADAMKVRDQLKRERDHGLSLDKAKVTTGEYLMEWIGNREASRELAQATVANYERYIRVWIVPYIGSIPLKDLSSYSIKSWHREARKQKASPRTLQAAHKVLKQALRDALIDNFILSNPCDSVKTPRADQGQRGYLEPNELKRMLMVLDSKDESSFTIAVRLGISTGARRGEILGLCWKHVDLADKSIEIRQSLAQVDGAKKLGENAKAIKAPKTAKGNRRVSLDDDVVQHLGKWKAKQARALLKLGIAQKPSTPVCCSLYDAETNGEPIYAGGFLDPQGFSSKFSRFCDEYSFRSTTGKRLCFHELRHTQATLLLSNGEDAGYRTKRVPRITV
ncbi:tyrosine-type recombinase/integrase [Raoultibacter phocaeensis]|uniref:tyrosine-type recombinase/integrase n=1 Tax=Raoultibacter phocaeensis TaxID=2479841 RepID=UPI00111A30F2|nr:tyrosine-type recombinase/integrase [Raoultibacter phocaeensis]